MTKLRAPLCLMLATLAAASLAAAPRRELPPLETPGAQARFEVARHLYERELTLVKLGEGMALLDGAIAELEGVIAIEPRAWVYYALGQALRGRGDCTRALDAYRHALARAPGEHLPAAMEAELERRIKQQIGTCAIDSPAARPSETPPPSPAVKHARPGQAKPRVFDPDAALPL